MTTEMSDYSLQNQQHTSGQIANYLAMVVTATIALTGFCFVKYTVSFSFYVLIGITFLFLFASAVASGLAMSKLRRDRTAGGWFNIQFILFLLGFAAFLVAVGIFIFSGAEKRDGDSETIEELKSQLHAVELRVTTLEAISLKERERENEENEPSQSTSRSPTGQSDQLHPSIDTPVAGP